MHLDRPSEQLLDVVDVEATGQEGEVFQWLCYACVLSINVRGDQWGLEDGITDGVELTLVHLLAAANV